MAKTEKRQGNGANGVARVFFARGGRKETPPYFLVIFCSRNAFILIS